MVIVGERKDSQTYVRMKRRACAEVGFRSFDCDLPGDSTQQEVLDAVAKFNANPHVHGILVQLPVGCGTGRGAAWRGAAWRGAAWRGGTAPNAGSPAMAWPASRPSCMTPPPPLAAPSAAQAH